MRRAYRVLYRGLLFYALVVGLIGNLAMLPRIGRPWGGFFVQWQQHDQAALIIPGNSPSAPGLRSGALQRGDIIRAVAGADLSTQSLPEAYEALYAAGAGSVQYVVQRGADLLAVEGPLLLCRWQDLVEYRAIYVLLALAAWLLGWIVLNASAATAANRAFTLFIVVAVILVLPGTFYFNNGRHDVLGVGLTMLTAIAFAPLAGAALLHFALSFPSEIGQRRAWLVYLPSLAVMAVHEYASARIFSTTPALIAAARVAASFNVVYAALGLVALLARCVHGLLAHRTGPRARHQISLVLLGFTFGVLLPGLPYAVYVLAASAYRSASALDRPLIAFLFPAAIGYAILRYQMFRGRSQALFTLIMLAVGATLTQAASVLLASLGPDGALGQNTILAGVIAVSLLTSLFWQSDRRLPQLFNRILRREESHYLALSNLIRGAGQATAVPDVARRVTGQLAEDFQAEYVSLWLYDGAQGWTLCHDHAAPGVSAAPAMAAELLASSGSGVRLAPDPRRPDRPPRPDTVELAAIIPLHAAAAPAARLGTLVLGPPRTGDIYDDRDLPLFAVIGEQVAAALVIAQQIEHLKREPQRVLAEVERERERIARELHDTVQQEMGALPYLLEAIQAAVGNPASVQPLFDACYDKLSRVSLELHNLRHDISPPELWSGDYTQALRELMYRKLAAQGIACTLDGSLPAALDRTQATALYRICQQAFDNIVQHACARTVRVTVTVQDAAGPQVCLRIADDGCGFDPAQLSVLAQDGHTGILSMRERVTALDGEFQIASVPGAGTAIEIRLPVAGTQSDAQAGMVYWL